VFICATLTNNIWFWQIFFIKNSSSVGNQSAKFQLNLFTQTTFATAFVRLPQNVKCPVLGNRLFNPDSVHGLPGNSMTNFLAPYPFFCFSSLIKIRSSAENTILLFFMLFWLSTNVTFAWATAVCNAILVTKIFCYQYLTFINFGKKLYFSVKFGSRFRNLLGIKCVKRYSYLFRFDIFVAQCLGGQFFTRLSVEWW